MLTPSLLRGLGPDALAVLLRRRPDLLSPVPPKSLAELIARLTHPVCLATALEGLSRPALDVTQALAALGPAADRARLDTLLGITPDDPRADAVTQALTELRDRLLLAEKCRLLPQLREHWRAPLGLGDDVATLATGSTVEDLLAVLRAVAPPVTATRKADLIARLVTALGDGERVRELVRSAPPGLAEKLVDVAFGRRQPDYYRWFSPRHHRPAGGAGDPWEWAMARFLVVRVDWTPTLQMPSEVALALRGPGWAAPFAVTAPEVGWTQQTPEVVTGACVAAAGQALRSLTAVLSAAGQQPIPLLKSGQVGVRELRRLAALAGCETGPLRLTLALAYWLDLLDLTENGLAPTPASDGWQRLPAAERAADLVRIWSTLPMSPLVEPAAAWAPQSDRQVVSLRRAVLDLLAEHPQAAADAPRSLTRLLHWRAPLLVPSSGPDNGPDGGSGNGPDGGSGNGLKVLAVLAEAAWLGVTGAGAFSAIGQAAQAGDDVAAAFGDSLGAVQVRARLQADLTAVVLGEPSPDLAAALDAMADRESRSAATTWRFSPVSVRRFLDTGAGEAEALDRLRDLADGPVPQPLDYLVRDVARRHGTLRGGGVSCYLRSSDKALLAELVVDRKLAKLQLRRVAPTIVVGAWSLPETLVALRAAGYVPVEEGSDGEIVPVRVPRYRAEGQTPDLSPEADGTVPETAGRAGRAAGSDPVAAAAALLAGPDRARGRLVDLGTCVVDIGSLEELGDQLFV